eukprot:CAMPEP_0115125354 /NCGR_PEP_ID=MMETSP0227-20121206/48977_1 /TAXON_ID=89957 /ORGANISM="Polarella glacialis, Strain CCMP 1383" /LENGTH=97 /DNA_ID=CAMNT_0002528679 /DNA_START=254 /DNA_END=544 /DNA_ORIENTATION=+
MASFSAIKDEVTFRTCPPTDWTRFVKTSPAQRKPLLATSSTPRSTSWLRSAALKSGMGVSTIRIRAQSSSSCLGPMHSQKPEPSESVPTGDTCWNIS